ncbi:Hypothetical Protein FCC1311_112562, partial [Hondaea fermentalgiana]
ADFGPVGGGAWHLDGNFSKLLGSSNVPEKCTPGGYHEMLVLEVWYEVTFAAVLYAGVYACAIRVLEQPHAIKLLTGMDVRVNYFSREVDVSVRHRLMHTVSAAISGALLCVNPLVRTAMYLTHGFVHVVELNRVLFAIFFLRAARCVDLDRRRVDVSLDLMSAVDAIPAAERAAARRKLLADRFQKSRASGALSRAASARRGYTQVRAIVTKVHKSDPVRGHATLRCEVLGKAPVTVKFLPPREGEEPLDSESVDLCPGEDFLLNCFDKEVVRGARESRVYVFSMAASLYQGRATFKSESARAEGDILLPAVYHALVRETPLAVVPTRHNFEGDSKYRRFVLPLAPCQEAPFADVAVLSVNPLAEGPQWQFEISRDGEPYVGLSNAQAQRGGVVGPDNVIVVSYVPHEGRAVDFHMQVAPPKLPEEPNPYDCFGFSDRARWARAAGNLVACAQGWFAYGYASRDRLEGLQAGEKEDVSCGMVERMSLDLAATLRLAGAEAPREEAEKALAEHKPPAPGSRANPLAKGLDGELRKGMVFNLSELSLRERGYFLDAAGERAEYRLLRASSEESEDVVAVFAICT